VSTPLRTLIAGLVRRTVGRRLILAGHLALAGGLACSAGCTWDRANFLAPIPPKAEPPAESLVLRADGLQPDKPATKHPSEGAMHAAREAFRREDYRTAESLFERIVDTKNPPVIVQEALYYRAESLRLDRRYPSACDVYAELLNRFPQTPYREQAVQHIYDIANYWLDDTRAEMKEDQERQTGKRWFSCPRFVSLDKTKPFMDREGRAVEALEKVRMHDISGPLADHALFMAGTVKLYHENYREADHYFSQIHKSHPNSELAPQAIKLAIYCKHMSTGGPDYDGRKTAEARKLVQVAFTSYPKLAHDNEKFLYKQLDSITLQQADKDLMVGDFYKRTGHPGSAFWYYELVMRRYPNTPQAQQAQQKRDEIRARLDKEASAPPAPPSVWKRMFGLAKDKEGPAKDDAAPRPMAVPSAMAPGRGPGDSAR
jgi:outer membrane protein assembly factor BamD (BamD/ComL family)